ncbi:hypothetical protein E1H12_22875 [Geitlerinema sp. P-1104]|nr:hypothetical protein [Geitlerinema sp. P-1104]
MANYTSAWGGMLITSFIKSEITFLTIENIHIWQWIFAIFMFLVTLFIEYPFFRISLRKQSEATVKTVKSLLAIHGISYLLLAAWYVAQSQTSMLTQLERVPVDTLDLPGQYQLYFQGVPSRCFHRLNSGLNAILHRRYVLKVPSILASPLAKLRPQDRH